ncbi:MAG: RHS repeat-associated core domain-containing protein [Limisphaerales bacterium]
MRYFRFLPSQALETGLLSNFARCGRRCGPCARRSRKACACGELPQPIGNSRLRRNPWTCFEGPFGEVTRATGPMAKPNPFRFSTKYQDDETDLVYYGYRYYSASTGRWLSRDPVHEVGSQASQLWAAADTAAKSSYSLGTAETDEASFPLTLVRGSYINEADVALGEDSGLNLLLFLNNSPVTSTLEVSPSRARLQSQPRCHHRAFQNIPRPSHCFRTSGPITRCAHGSGCKTTTSTP